MKSYKTLTLGAVISSLLLSASFSANAATSTAAVTNVINVTSGTSGVVPFLKVNGASWVSESMGYTGWTHFSKWGIMNVTKGKTVTIVADASAVDGFHPGITVWQRKTNLKADNTALQYMNDHSYGQSDDINVLNAKDEITGLALPGEKNIIMTYLASGYDIDGLGDQFSVDASSGTLKEYNAAAKAAVTTAIAAFVASPDATAVTKAEAARTTALAKSGATAESGKAAYDASILASATAASTPVLYGAYMPMGFNTASLTKATKVSDGVAGKVQISFTAPATGVYQFVVGGLKPDKGSTAAVNADAGSGNVNTVNVTVTTN